MELSLLAPTRSFTTATKIRICTHIDEILSGSFNVYVGGAWLTSKVVDQVTEPSVITKTWEGSWNYGDFSGAKVELDFPSGEEIRMVWVEVDPGNGKWVAVNTEGTKPVVIP